MKTRFPLSLLALALLLVMVGVGVLASSDSAPVPQRHGLWESFAILRSSPEEALTAADRKSFKSAALVESHGRIESAQRVRNHGSLWVLCAGRHLCIAQPRGAACALENAASRHGVVLGTFLPPTGRHPIPHNFLLQGVVPDDVRKVMVVIGADRQLIARVTGNAFSVERDEPVRLKRLLRD